MRWSALALVVLLLGSLMPFSMAQDKASNTTEVQQLTFDNATREQIIAEQLINQLMRLSEFTKTRIEPIRDKLPENSTILVHYEKAEEFKEKALEEFNNGDYYNSILDALTAMHHYKIVLRELKEGKEKFENAREWIRAEIERTIQYFRFVEKTIHLAEKEGIDVNNLTRLYNETKQAYKVVLDDIRAKDFEKAREDLRVAREKKAQLDEELRKVRKELAYANADKIVKEFLVRTDRGITFAERAIQEAKARGIDTSEAEAKLEEIKSIYEEVKSLAEQEKWKDALTVIIENKPKIDAFFRALNKIHERFAEEKIKRDVKVFLKEMQDRIRKDSRALRELKNRGVDTRRAEIELRTAAQELQMGLRLLKERKLALAREHFGIALRLLYNVEQFILLHS
ncbi:hypothetical protein [Thermococcus paralvinellae]|uniref:DNA double-strand break repair Rad50 ATPase n=1 Tax=Thermococcus paralvinellae TaxID=582419 RepID=W0I2D0_9EURY|nr:hypothetical protein [Thermococcus paralvinellae]AHF80206.1 Hypothetical protein TES1_0820 [Thermococcus paralvinellae]